MVLRGKSVKTKSIQLDFLVDPAEEVVRANLFLFFQENKKKKLKNKINKNLEKNSEILLFLS